VGQSASSARYTGTASEGHPDLRGHPKSRGATPESAAAADRAADSAAAAAATSVRQRAPASREDRVTSLTGQVWTSDTRRSHSAAADTTSEESCSRGAHRERESSWLTTPSSPEVHEQRLSESIFVNSITCQGRRFGG
jgi:hypothetical protein